MRTLRVDLRAALQASKNDFEMEKKRSNELADLLHQKTKQCVKIQVPPCPPSTPHIPGAQYFRCVLRVSVVLLKNAKHRRYMIN